MKESFSVSTQGVTLEYRTDAPSGREVVNAQDEMMLVYVIDGVGRYVVDGRGYDLLPRALFFTLPTDVHAIVQDVPSSVERYTLRFSRSSISEKTLAMLTSRLDGSGESAIYYSVSELSLAIASAFERFEMLDSLPERGRAAYASALLGELVILLSLAEEKRVSTKESLLGTEVQKYIDENLSRNISLDRLAKRFFVSKYYLCRAFKSYTGTSVHSYINEKRILHAKALIESGETASRAAYSVGFGDYSSFYRAYVRVIGRSPGEIKNICKDDGKYDNRH